MFPWISMLLVAAVLGGLWRWRMLKRSRERESETRHLIVISMNSQATIEWWIRSFVYWNWIRGRTCRCTCIDLGSTDDTYAILRRLQRRFEWMDIERWEASEREQPAARFIPKRLMQAGAVVVDLRQPEHDRTIRSFV